MKKFFLLFAFGALGNLSSMAQPSMTIINQTPCAVTYVLAGTSAGTCYPTGSLNTNIITLPAFTNASFAKISTLNSCPIGVFWIQSCNPCSNPPPCTCVKPTDPGIWEWVDVGTPGNPPGTTMLGSGGVNVQIGPVGNCPSGPLHAKWTKDPVTSDVTLEYSL